jgi:hypothetical protein
MHAKGTKLRCVNADFPLEVKRVYQQLPKAGETYTVRASFVGRNTAGEEGEIGLLFEELRNQPDPFVKGEKKPELGFSSERFSDAT